MVLINLNYKLGFETFHSKDEVLNKNAKERNSAESQLK